MTLLLAALALAGDDSTRCVAQWTGPVEGCQLRGSWDFSATASTEKGARKALQRHMNEVIDRAKKAEISRVNTLTEGQFILCEDVVPKAFVNCFPEPHLDQDLMCFAELKDRDCWNGEILPVEDIGWRALQVGRSQMCAAVDRHIVTQGYTDAEARRVACASTCMAETVVRCPDPNP